MPLGELYIHPLLASEDPVQHLFWMQGAGEGTYRTRDVDNPLCVFTSSGSQMSGNEQDTLGRVRLAS